MGEVRKVYDSKLKRSLAMKVINVQQEKEIEYQELEAQLAEKRIKENGARIDDKKEIFEEVKGQLSAKKDALEAKNKELKEIISETEKEEKTLLEKSKEFEKKIEDNLISAYKRIRLNVKNGLAIVPVERNASGGSYFTIPPQVQMEIASRQKIITDEYSGRILVDPKLAEEEMEKMKSIFS